MSPRAVSVIGAACLLAGWLMASVVSPPVASLQSNPERAPTRADAMADRPPAPPYTERLRLRLRESPGAPAPRRNPFIFAEQTRSASPASMPRAMEEAAPVLMSPGPAFDLAGIATSGSDAEPARTAVVSVRGDVLLVRAGDRLPGGYTVVRVDEDALIVADTSGRELVLHLK